MAVSFDPNKPHGTVHSDRSPIKFFQFGHHFTADGKEYVPPPDPLAPDAIEAEIQRRVAAELAARTKK